MNAKPTSDAHGLDGEATGAQLRAVSEPQFRTVPTPEGRKGVRLEAAFWEALDVQSGAVGQRSSSYAGKLLAEAHQAGVNATSALRSRVVADLTAEVKLHRPVIALSEMLRMLQSAPVPSFALDRNKRLLRANTEFSRYVRAIAGSNAGSVSIDLAQLSLERPIDSLFEELTAAPVVECGIAVRLDNRERRSGARFILVPPLPAVAMVGYVLP